MWSVCSLPSSRTSHSGEYVTCTLHVSIVNAILAVPAVVCIHQSGRHLLYVPYLTLPYLTLPYLTLPYRTVPYRTVPYRTVPYRTVPYRTVPYLTLPYLTLPYLTLPYLTLPYLTLPYLTLPYLTLPYLTLPYLTLPVPPGFVARKAFIGSLSPAHSLFGQRFSFLPKRPTQHSLFVLCPKFLLRCFERPTVRPYSGVHVKSARQLLSSSIVRTCTIQFLSLLLCLSLISF